MLSARWPWANGASREDLLSCAGATFGPRTRPKATTAEKRRCEKDTKLTSSPWLNTSNGDVEQTNNCSLSSSWLHLDKPLLAGKGEKIPLSVHIPRRGKDERRRNPPTRRQR